MRPFAIIENILCALVAAFLVTLIVVPAIAFGVLSGSPGATPYGALVLWWLFHVALWIAVAAGALLAGTVVWARFSAFDCFDCGHPCFSHIYGESRDYGCTVAIPGKDGNGVWSYSTCKCNRLPKTIRLNHRMNLKEKAEQEAAARQAVADAARAQKEEDRAIEDAMASVRK
jgi:hypothetical protein